MWFTVWARARQRLELWLALDLLVPFPSREKEQETSPVRAKPITL